MRKAFNIIGLALALLLAFSSCQKAPFLTFTGQRSFTFKDAGGSETITFSCNRAWTVTSSESWITISPAKGEANEGGVKVTITCAANTTYDSRNATVTISSEGLTETISVSQDTNYGLISEPTTFNLTNAAQNIEVEVKANVEYTITIDDACKDWISQVGTKALSSTKLTFSIAANEGYDDREGKITISQKGSATSVQPQVITVKQSQTNGLFITTPEYALSNESHELTIEVKANVNYEVTPEVDWIKYEASSTKALSTTTFTLKVDKNETYDQRVGTVKVKGGGLEGIITITQAENLGLFVSPTEAQISKDAQEVEVEVNTNVDYDIVIPEEAKGMITTVKTEGGETKALVAKKVRFGVSENPKYGGREASVTFKQKDGALSGTVKISQVQRDTLWVEPLRDSISFKGGDIYFNVITNVDYSITVEQATNWVKIGEQINKENTDGLSRYESKLIINENDGLDTRCGKVSIMSKDNNFVNEFIVVQGNQPVVDLSIGGTSNCYIVSNGGWYKFPCKYKGNSTDAISGYVSASIIWESYNTSSKPQKGDVIKNALLKDDFIYFYVPLDFNQGNALVAATNERGSILWSWHIWITEYNPNEEFDIYKVSNSIVMNRNLGALSKTPGDITANGLMYQWGRKDPFMGPALVSSLEQPFSIEESNEITGTVYYSVEHPTVFITEGAHQVHDWHYGYRDYELWATKKTKYDPCPSGWKVAEMEQAGGGVWRNFPIGYEKDATFNSELKGIIFGDYYSNPPTWYPANGQISGTDGGYCDFQHSGYVWSSGAVDNFARQFMFLGDGFVTTCSGSMLSNGQAVRCQKE